LWFFGALQQTKDCGGLTDAVLSSLRRLEEAVFRVLASDQALCRRIKEHMEPNNPRVNHRLNNPFSSLRPDDFKQRRKDLGLSYIKTQLTHKKIQERLSYLRGIDATEALTHPPAAAQTPHLRPVENSPNLR
jgi:hypothetical protein